MFQSIVRLDPAATALRTNKERKWFRSHNAASQRLSDGWNRWQLPDVLFGCWYRRPAAIFPIAMFPMASHLLKRPAR
jgi:hypothetical protein